MAKTLLMSGFELRGAEVGDAQLLHANPPVPGLLDVRSAVTRALEDPVSGEPLSALLKPGTRVSVVLDDFSLPVPPMAHDTRRELLEAVLAVLSSRGLNSKRVSVVVANGLSRQWREQELTELLGASSTSTYPVSCHDAEALADVVRLGEEPEGPVELSRRAVEVDVLIHLNLVSMPLMAGTYGLTAGIAGYRTARWLAAPERLEHDDAPLSPGSEYHRAHERVAAHLLKRTRVFQVSAVLNSEMWAPAFAKLLKTDPSQSRPMQMWNALPAAVRQRAARLLKASYRPFAIHAGPPQDVAPKMLEAFAGQHAVKVQTQADIVVFGLPDQGPSSVGSAQNPVLAANLALGYVSNLFLGPRPLLRPGGVMVIANPLAPTFDRVHLPHQEFYEKVLRLTRDSREIHEKFEPYFAGRPEFVSNYQRRFAFHGAHPLYSWYLTSAARRRAARIFAAYGDPRACARLGFSPAGDVEEALEKAREVVGVPNAKVAVLELPPPFWTEVA